MADGHVLSLRHVFDAPPALVWAALTRPEMLMAWWGPPDSPAIHADHDARPGGGWRACLLSPTGCELWQGGTYFEVVPPERLVFSFKWESNDHEDREPVDTLVTMILTELSDGRTQLDFTQTGLKSAESVGNHGRGWGGSFDRLDQMLETQKGG